MEYRRRTQQPSRRKRQNTSSGSGGKFFLTILIIAAAVYLLSASAVGTWVAQNIMAPIFEAFNSGDATPSDTPGTTLIPSGTPSIEIPSGSDGVTGELTLPAIECYMIQMGIYSTIENAETAAQSIQVKGAGGYIMQDGEYYRVFASGYSDEESAKLVRDKLREADEDSTVHAITTPAITFTVTASLEQTQSISSFFNALASAQGDMLQCAINFDKNNIGIEECKTTLEQISDDLNAKQQDLSAQASQSAVLTSVLSCYNAYIEAIETLLTYKGENTVDFSSKMKYTQILMTLEYVKLTQILSQ